VAMAALVALTAAACGGDDDNDASSSAAAPASAADTGASSAAAPAEDTAAADTAAADTGAADTAAADTAAADTAAAEDTAAANVSGDITVWIMGADTDPSNEVVKAQAKAFEEQYPGTKIDLQFVAWTQAHDKFTTAIAGQKTPDVAEIGSTWTPEFAATGAFAEQPAPPEGQYLSALQDAGTLDGKFYGLPWYAGARALFYRTDVFEELGIAPPTTWDEWLAAMQKIKDAGEIDPFGAATVQDGMHMFLPLVWQAGGEIATNEGGEWVSKMDTPEAVEGLDLWAKIYQEGYSPKASVSWSGLDAEKAFITGQVASFIGVGWMISDIQKQAPDLKWTTAPVPAGPSGKATVFAGGSTLAVFEGSDNKDLANAFVQFMLQKDNVTEFASKAGLFPGTVEAMQAGPFLSQDLSGVMGEEILNDSKTYPTTPIWGTFEGSNLFQTAMQDIMNGRSTAEEAGKKLAEEMNKEFSAK
jgi:N,N'-diacetylchitobiose transport system substrate-binding protein